MVIMMPGEVFDYFHFCKVLVEELGYDQAKVLKVPLRGSSWYIQTVTYVDVGWPDQTPYPPQSISVEEALLTDL